MDTNGNAVAVFCISGFSKDMHKHTLGISIAAATAISNQLQLHGLYTHTLSIKNQLQMIMDMMDRGIILVGPDLKISHINDYALKMLNIGEENLLHKPISSIIHNIKFNELQEDIDNIETSITLGHKSQKIFIGVRCISPHLATHQQNPSFLLTLRDKKSVHKLVNAVIGSNAYFQFDDIIGSSVELERVKRLAKIAASNNSNVLLCGPSGAGHFVKMMHNGIEYGMMQAYAEGFALMEASPYAEDLDLQSIAHLWNQGSVVRSWLLELIDKALGQDPRLAGLQPHVEDSGEGRWMVREAVDRSVSMPVITLALMERFRSRDKNSFADRMLAAMRREFGGHAVRQRKE